jgi:hypothetical protein
VSFLLDCRDMSRRLSDARDFGRALGLRERLHLAICDVCRRVRAQFDRLGAIVKIPSEAGPSLSFDAKERLRSALKNR